MLGKLLLPSLLFVHALLLPVIAAAAGSEVAQNQEISLLPLKIALVIGLAISIWGIYKSRKKKIVVFANLTDILATLAIPATTALFVFLAIFLEMKGILASVVIAAPTLAALFIVLKGTYAYNASINAGLLGFALSAFTKFFLLTLYVIILLLIFFSGNRREGESEAAFRRRNRRETSIAFLHTTTLFGIMAWLGLWDKNFVTLQEFINGDWGHAEPIQAPASI